MVLLAEEDFDFAGGVGITDGDSHGEAIELRFGEGIGAVIFRGVLGGDDEEGEREISAFAVHCDLGFAHHFQKRRLCARAGAVDFIGEQHVGEDGAFAEFERAILGL